MTVALDATPLATGSGGIRRYTVELLQALAEEFPQDSFFAASDQPFECPRGVGRLPAPASWLDHRWWLWGLPERLRGSRAAVFHGTDFAVPYRRVCPSVVTVHDLSPWQYPQLASGRVRRRFPWLLRTGRIAHIITPSKAVRSEVIHLWGWPERKVTSIPLAASRGFRPTLGAPAARPYFLVAGGTPARKNLALVLEALGRVRQTHNVDLVITGSKPSGFGPLQGVRATGEVPDTELARLYTHAVATLYPSSYEGFGLPVVEAMQCGCPVVVSRAEALRETAGSAALIAGDSAADWEHTMLQLLDEPTLRAGLREAGFTRAREFSWAATARRTREVYTEVAPGA